MPKQDYYKILGIERNATKNEIKMAFKQLARKYHPDVAENKEEAEIKFREINEAYSILCDDDKRTAYDRYGHSGLSGFSGQGDGFPFGGFEEFGGLGDIFDMFFDMGGGRGRRQSGARQQNQSVRGRDIRYDLEIELEDAYKGFEKDIEIETYQPCPVCNGRRVKPGAGFVTCQYCQGAGVQRNVQNTMFGQFISTATCNYCNGQGQIPEVLCEECRGGGKTISRRKISVKIPAGADNGTRLRISEEGEAGEFGGPSGDLYIFVSVKDHDIFTRRGKDLFMDFPIGFVDSAIGAKKEIYTFDGDATLDIPAGTQPETVITVRGKGMPDIKKSAKGDLHVRIKVMTPTKLNKKQKELLLQFAEAGPQFHLDKKSIFGKIMDAIKGK